MLKSNAISNATKWCQPGKGQPSSCQTVVSIISLRSAKVTLMKSRSGEEEEGESGEGPVITSEPFIIDNTCTL